MEDAERNRMPPAQNSPQFQHDLILILLPSCDVKYQKGKLICCMKGAMLFFFNRLTEVSLSHCPTIF